jgi:hypothetical protein
MINDKAKKVERKIVSLIVINCSNRHKKNWNPYARMRYRIEKFKTKNPEQFNTSLNIIVAELDKVEQGANSA